MKGGARRLDSNMDSPAESLAGVQIIKLSFSPRPFQTVNPNTKACEEERGRITELSNHFLSHTCGAAWDLRAAWHALGCARPGCQPARTPPGRHLPAQVGPSTWEPRAPKARRGGGSGEPAPPGGLAHCHAIGVVFPGPSLPRPAPRPSPRGACGPPRVAPRFGDEAGTLSDPAPRRPGGGSTRRSRNRRRAWDRVTSPASARTRGPHLREATSAPAASQPGNAAVRSGPRTHRPPSSRGAHPLCPPAALPPRRFSPTAGSPGWRPAGGFPWR